MNACSFKIIFKFRTKKYFYIETKFAFQLISTRIFFNIHIKKIILNDTLTRYVNNRKSYD